ncbi:hypothetical protein PUR21_21785 [Methylorubrum rhodesianum]|uniref:TIGR02646 family protein n=1 Tax=Methylorubrum rhodesianum TaxID=29427 RepID=A0ABU9ZFV3_9HYPH
MIRIVKGVSPRKLTTDGATRARAHQDEYDADGAGFRAGTSKFSFPRSVYAHKTVRDALERIQHGKCCYCEAKPEKPYAHLHVDHWRPKSCTRQDRAAEESWPGYYWLAYTWDNLLLGCHFCNSANKGDLFPLVDPAERALDHHTDIAGERPLLLKPDGPEDPAAHIGYHEEVPVGLTPEGRATIAVLGLDRTEHAPRLDLLNRLKRSRDVVHRYHGDTSPAGLEFVARARGVLERAVRPDAPFSAMATAYLSRNPLPP